MTKTSTFLLFLVKICFISIVRTEQKNRFSLIKLIVYIAYSVGFIVVTGMLSNEFQASMKNANNDNDHQFPIQVKSPESEQTNVNNAFFRLDQQLIS